MALHRFNVAELVASPWKNGGGVTHEIVSQPQGAGTEAFDWRVSIARIDNNGAFSVFPGVDRVITLIDGAGVHLRTSDGTLDHRLDKPLEPFAFVGEAPVLCELLAGGCSDFNVMTRRASCRARVQVLRKSTALTGSRQGLLMAVCGSWRAMADKGTVHHLEAQDGLWWHAASTSWHLETSEHDGALLAVQIDSM